MRTRSYSYQRSHQLRWLWACMLVGVFVCGGATCVGRSRPKNDVFAPPVVFQQPPSLQELTNFVNRSLKLERLECNNLSITSPEITGKLNGDLVWERPRNFKFSAYFGPRMFGGPVLAAGSNDEMFWMQTTVPPPPTLVYANHEQFNSQAGPRKILPVSPLWLREALGVVEIDPTLIHEGPHIQSDGRVALHTQFPTHRGIYTRVLVFDASHATIQETRLYDPTNKLIAHAHQSEHWYSSEIDMSLPLRVDVQLYPDEGPKLAFTIEVGFYLLNEPSSASPSTFAMPETTGISTYDLVQLNQSNQAVLATPPTYTQANPVIRSTLVNQRTFR
ncbi:MAG: hypothetical protein KDB22_10840 [Planctomycetales bacterium]|nr:hypothetical protein [Planctomycetales bacterium]